MEEELDKIAILAKDAPNEDERGEAMVAGGLAVRAANEVLVNQGGFNEVVAIGLVSATEGEFASSVVEVIIG